jgi:hypothetical protein
MSANKPKLALARPSVTRASAARTAAKLEGEGSVRLVLELSPATRQALKVRAAQAGVTLKGYLLGLAAKDGVEVVDVLD